MKKLLFVFSFIMFVTVSNAQDGGGQRRGGDPAQMREAMKQRMKEELKFSDQITDSVVSIQMEFQMESRKIRQDASSSDDAKKASTQKIADIRDAKLKAFLNADQYTALEAYNEKMRKAREERMKNRQ